MHDAAIDASHRRVLLNVSAVSNAQSESEFWAEMLLGNRTHSEFLGVPISPALMPRDVAAMLDDVWRSLCYWVRSNGGYGAVSVPPFADFLWARFFAAALPPPPPLGTSQQTAAFCKLTPFDAICIGGIAAQLNWLNYTLPAALSLAASNSARSLPGFGAGVVDPPKCDW